MAETFQITFSSFNAKFSFIAEVLTLKIGVYRVSASLAGNVDIDQYFTVESSSLKEVFCCLIGFVVNHMAKICNMSVEFRVSTGKDW